MLILGLSGPRGCGKTTAAALLVQESGFVSVAFADPIRDSLLGLFRDWDSGHFETPAKDACCPRYGISPRDALRAFGDHARGLDPLIYVAHMARQLEALEAAKAPRVVIHDVRLPSEADLIRSRGGWVVHVRRRGWEWAGDHVTEQGPGMALGDLSLPNPGTVGTYAQCVRALLSAVGVGGGRHV